MREPGTKAADQGQHREAKTQFVVCCVGRKQATNQKVGSSNLSGRAIFPRFHSRPATSLLPAASFAAPIGLGQLFAPLPPLFSGQVLDRLFSPLLPRALAP